MAKINIKLDTLQQDMTKILNSQLKWQPSAEEEEEELYQCFPFENEDDLLAFENNIRHDKDKFKKFVSYLSYKDTCKANHKFLG